MNDKKILSAEEMLELYDIGIEQESKMFEFACDAMREYHEQFCRMPTDNEIRREAVSRNVHFSYIETWSSGAKFVRDNFMSDAVEFAEWIAKDLPQSKIEMTTNELYQEFLNQKNKKG